MIAAKDNSYISNEETEKIIGMLNEALRILNGYINFLKREQEKNGTPKKSKSLTE